MSTSITARRAAIAIGCVAVALAFQPLTGAAGVPGAGQSRQAAPPPIPESIRSEHAAIHAELMHATSVRGRVGGAARRLAKVLQPHFEREEQIALPPLGLVAPLARGEYAPGMRAVLPMTDSLRNELPRMLAEHVTIRAATTELERVAVAEGNARVVRLARQLALHARSEEELLYPMAVLVGDLVRARTTTTRR
jgi:hypothetical protein